MAGIGWADRVGDPASLVASQLAIDFLDVAEALVKRPNRARLRGSARLSAEGDQCVILHSDAVAAAAEGSLWQLILPAHLAQEASQVCGRPIRVLAAGFWPTYRCTIQSQCGSRFCAGIICLPARFYRAAWLS